MPLRKTTDRIRGTTPQIEKFARQLRQKLTPAEAYLWEALRNKQLGGLRFRCQHPVGRFILDFYCPACKLVIEVDGGIHETQLDYDEARTQHLQQYGYRVLRFTNDEVMSDRDRVLQIILTTAQTPLSPESTAP
jgi:very-short-patch-repair endonuclease